MPNEPLDLDAIEARAERTPEGPWTVHYSYDRRTYEVYGDGCIIASRCTLQEAAFIAAARADIPALIDKVREQEREIADLRVECRVYERASTVDAPQELARLAELHRRPTLEEVLAVLAPPGFTQDYDGAVPLYDVRARLRGLFADVAAR